MKDPDCGWCCHAKTCESLTKFRHFIMGYCGWFRTYDDLDEVIKQYKTFQMAYDIRRQM